MNIGANRLEKRGIFIEEVVRNITIQLSCWLGGAYSDLASRATAPKA